MVSGWKRWLGLLPALLLPALGVLPDAAFSERGPRATVVATAPDTDDQGYGRAIVKYRSGSALARTAAGQPRQAGRLGRELALSLRDGHVLGSRTQSLKAMGLSSQQLAARLATHAEVEWAVPVRRKTVLGVVPNDPYYRAGQTGTLPVVGQWYLRAPDATAVAAINAEAAWAITTGSAAVTVAVLDTGVIKTHPDLAGKLWDGYDFISRTSNSADGDGRDADASDPGDWSSAADSCGAGNSSWHGTQVAGLIGAATDNGIGMASVGRDVMLLPVRVIGKCGGYDDDIIAGMRWAAGLSNSPVANPHPARVINLSLGSSGSCSTAYRDAVAELNSAGVAVVVAAGNDAGHAVNEPANCPGALAVAGVRHAGSKVGYSSIGPEVAIAAPAGNCVNDTGACLYPLLTTINTGSTSVGTNTYSDSYDSSLGTSFATPIVAGTVGLMLSANAALTPAQIKSLLQASARRFPVVGAQSNNAPVCAAPSGQSQLECYCTTSTCGAGLLDAGAAIGRASALAVPPVAVFAAAAEAPTVGVAVALDGAPSSASVTAYQWSITSGAPLASFSGATDRSRVTLVAGAPGTVVVTLSVTDGAGVSRSTSRTLTPTLAPTAVLNTSNAHPTVGSPIALDGRDSPASPGRSIARYDWSITPVNGVAQFATATNASTAVLTPLATGTVTVQLTVTDNTGDSRSTSQTLDVGMAPAAVISAAGLSPVVGSSVTLDGGQSTAAAGHSITAYQWVITSGAGLASLAGGNSGSTATLSTTAAGTVVVSLTVTDDAGAASTTSQTFTVMPAPVVVSGGGGGALGWGWLGGLLLAVLALGRRRGS